MKRGSAMLLVAVGATVLLGYQRVEASDHWLWLLAVSVISGTAAALLDAAFASSGSLRRTHVAEAATLALMLMGPTVAIGGLQFSWVVLPTSVAIVGLHWVRDSFSGRNVPPPC